jgi:hypothetical protein
MIALKKTLALLIFSSLSNACLASPESDRRLEISEIKSQLNALDKRIKLLESSLPSKDTRDSAGASTVPAAWKDAKNWTRIQVNMSRAQVEAILGKPVSSKKDIISYVTLYYQGQIPGAGHISGNVKLDDNDQVAFINPPVF